MALRYKYCSFNRMHYCAKVFAGMEKCCKVKLRSNRKTSDWLQIHFAAGQWTQTYSQYREKEQGVVKVTLWLPQSPDLSNVSRITWRDRRSVVSSQRCLENLPAELLQKLRASLPKRTDAVLKATTRIYETLLFLFCSQTLLFWKHSYFKAFLHTCLKHLQSSLRQR